jgi:hypothetical protein
MGTRGAFGVIAGERELIGYNQFDSYPNGGGITNLGWLRSVIEGGELAVVFCQAVLCRLVDNDQPPKAADVEALADATDLNVSERSKADWYCLTRHTHGDIGAMLACGYIFDSHTFPLDSLFCEWGYIVDFDKGVFEVYQGFQESLPKLGRWAGRPTEEEVELAYSEHLGWCAENGRDPWRPEVSEYKAIELVASYAFSSLPDDEQFLEDLREEEEAE